MRWDEVGACRGQYIEDFYPDNNVVLKAVKDICSDCPARTACLIASIPERYGFWAGKTMIDRDRLRKSAGIRLAPDDGDVPHYRSAADEGWRTGDYVAALSKVLGADVAIQILEADGVISRRVA